MDDHKIWVNAIPVEAVRAARTELPGRTDDDITDDDIRRAVFEALKTMDGQTVLEKKTQDREQADQWMATCKAQQAHAEMALSAEQLRLEKLAAIPSDYDLWRDALAVAAPMVGHAGRQAFGRVEALQELFTLAEGIWPSLVRAAGRPDPMRIDDDTDDDEVERLCEVMHDAYETAAAGAGWETQESSRKPWADVPEPNRITMRAAVRALLEETR